MKTAAHFRWRSGADSDVGLVRENNEDACLDRPQRGLWAVADGLGGHALGEFASRMVVDALDEPDFPDSLAEAGVLARRRMQAVNQRLREEAASRGVGVIGSTVVLLFARGRYCRYLWAGDSRLYLCRNGALRQLSRDHNLAAAWREAGQPAAQAAPGYPAGNLITRAVGAQEHLDLDTDSIEVRDGDIFLLCSDGLSNEVGDAEICTLLLAGNCQHAAETLVECALRHGGRDNVTVVVVRAEDLQSSDSTAVNPVL